MYNLIFIDKKSKFKLLIKNFNNNNYFLYNIRILQVKTKINKILQYKKYKNTTYDYFKLLIKIFNIYYKNSNS